MDELKIVSRYIAMPACSKWSAFHYRSRWKDVNVSVCRTLPHASNGIAGLWFAARWLYLS